MELDMNKKLKFDIIYNFLQNMNNQKFEQKKSSPFIYINFGTPIEKLENIIETLLNKGQ